MTTIPDPQLVDEPSFVLILRHSVTYKRIAEINQFISFTWKHVLGHFGNFKLVIDNSSPIIDTLIQFGGIVELLIDGEQEFTGWISFIAQDIDGPNHTWEFIGWDAPGSVVKRITHPAPLISNDVSTIALQDFDTVEGVNIPVALRYYVDVNLISSYEPSRIVPNLQLGRITLPSRFPNPLNTILIREDVEFEDLDATFIQTTFKARFYDLPNVLSTLSEAGGVGWKFRLSADEGIIYFDVNGGADRSEGNTSGFKPVTFQLSRGDVNKARYELDGIDSVNVVYAAAEGESATRVVTTNKITGEVNTVWLNTDPLGNPFAVPFEGLGRREAAIDVGPNITEEESRKLADQYLAEHGIQQRISWTPRNTTINAYRRTYENGDIVTFLSPEMRINAGIKARITAVEGSLAAGSPLNIQLSIGSTPRTTERAIREIDYATKPIRMR